MAGGGDGSRGSSCDGGHGGSGGNYSSMPSLHVVLLLLPRDHGSQAGAGMKEAEVHRVGGKTESVG
eukprot:6181911-Pleurochrysis_carterae.AAC.1